MLHISGLAKKHKTGRDFHKPFKIAIKKTFKYFTIKKNSKKTQHTALEILYQ